MCRAFPPKDQIRISQGIFDEVAVRVRRLTGSFTVTVKYGLQNVSVLGKNFVHQYRFRLARQSLVEYRNHLLIDASHRMQQHDIVRSRHDGDMKIRVASNNRLLVLALYGLSKRFLNMRQDFPVRVGRTHGRMTGSEDVDFAPELRCSP